MSWATVRVAEGTAGEKLVAGVAWKVAFGPVL